MSGDPSEYPGTNVLVNLPGLKDQELLDIFERTRSALREMELMQKPLQGNFDLQHLQGIHRYLFQDVYPLLVRLERRISARGIFGSRIEGSLIRMRGISLRN